MDDNIGFLTLAALSILVIVAVFGALFWAAVHDGRDEEAFRSGRPST